MMPTAAGARRHKNIDCEILGVTIYNFGSPFDLFVPSLISWATLIAGSSSVKPLVCLPSLLHEKLELVSSWILKNSQRLEMQ